MTLRSFDKCITPAHYLLLSCNLNTKPRNNVVSIASQIRLENVPKSFRKRFETPSKPPSQITLPTSPLQHPRSFRYILDMCTLAMANIRPDFSNTHRGSPTYARFWQPGLTGSLQLRLRTHLHCVHYWEQGNLARIHRLPYR